MHAQIDQIASAIDELSKFYWLDGLWASVSSIHRRCGSPEAPDSSFGHVPRTLPFLKPKLVANLGAYEQFALESYNKAVVAAYGCIAWRHVGFLAAVANEAKGNESWNAYLLDARTEINKYFQTGEAFRDFEAYVLEPGKKELGI